MIHLILNLFVINVVDDKLRPSIQNLSQWKPLFKSLHWGKGYVNLKYLTYKLHVLLSDVGGIQHRSNVLTLHPKRGKQSQVLKT